MNKKNNSVRAQLSTHNLQSKNKRLGWENSRFQKKTLSYRNLITISVLMLLGLSGCDVFAGGASNVREKDGMEMVYIPEGKSLMGDNDSWYDDQHPEQEIYLDAFWIDKYEVTNGQYSICVKDGICTEPTEAKSVTREEYYGVEEFDSFPVINVTWHQASEYCQWAGGSLPTEAQWEKAARGTDGRTYPWGEEEPTCNFANSKFEDGECVGDTVSVGSYPKGASPYGVLDMTGNASEWVADWYSGIAYYHMPQENPTGPPDGDYRVIRGGSWQHGENFARSSSRFRVYPVISWNNLGFRCAYPVVEE